MMRVKCGLTAATAVLLLTFGTPPSASADTWNKKTTLTVNETIQVPGATLQPGTYVVKLIESASNRHIVLITDEREGQVITTILAIPNYRLKPTGETQFDFWETPAGTPKAVRAWFYPGDNFGQEFAYPKRVSTEIARVAEAPVPTTEARTPAEMKSAPVTTIDRSGEAKPLEPKEYARAAPQAAPAEQPAAAPAPVAAQPTPAAAEELPATATPLPTFGVAAAFALFAGLGIRAFARRR